jgi:DNA-binding NarL/FixJ family response regulator
MKPTIALIEDDDFTRFTLVSAVKQLGFDVIYESGSASQAMLAVPQLKPDLAILDLHLGAGPTGVDLARSLRTQLPNLGLLILSSFEDPRLLNSSLPAVPAGALYLTKSSIRDGAALNSALTKALLLRGDEKVTSQVTNSPFSKFSAIQLETLRLMAKGLSNAEIAKRRFVTEKSVEISISRIAKKLGLQKNDTINQRVHIANVYFRASGQSLEDD